MVVMKVGDVRVGGGFIGNRSGKQKRPMSDLRSWDGGLGDGQRMVIGDWNAHHERWACEGTQENARGRRIAEWMDESGLYLKGVAMRQQDDDHPVAIDFTYLSVGPRGCP